MTLNGKVALIVGGSQGIGAAVAHRLATDGAVVGIVASTRLEKAEAIAQTIREMGGSTFATAFDVRDFKATKAAVDAVVSEHGSVDILFNGAGVFYPTPVAGDSAFDAVSASNMIDTNLKGTLNGIAAVTPYMKKSRSGNIVNVSSCAGVMGQGTYSTYCATKSAVIMLTRALAIELAPYDINVNAIAPGNTETPINEDIRTNPELSDFLGAITEKTPSNQTYSSPEDMANLVSFLVSGQARAMHGSTVLMDEGFSAGL